MQVERRRTISLRAAPVAVVRRATANFVEDRCTQQAAAISYFALFALFPLVMLAASIFGIVLRDADVRARVLESLVDALPIEDASISKALVNASELGPTLGVLALIGTIWTAGALSGAVRRGLEVAFEDDNPRPLLRAKLVDYTVLPVLALLFLASLVLTTTWSVLRAEADERLSFTEGALRPLWEAGAVAIPAVLSFVAFLFLYWLMPNQRLRLRYIWPGALIAAIAFEVVKFGFTIYLANFGNYDVIYGSLGGVIILLFWVYLTANILLYGAQVAAEVPHVLFGEARHGHAGAKDEGWQRSLRAILRGLVLTPGGDGGVRTKRLDRRDR